MKDVFKNKLDKAVEGLGTIILVHDFSPNCKIFFHLSPTYMAQ